MDTDEVMEGDVNIALSVSEQRELLLKFHNLHYDKKKIQSQYYIGDIVSSAINCHIPMHRHELKEEHRAFLANIWPLEYMNQTPVQDPPMMSKSDDDNYVKHMLKFDTDALRNMYPHVNNLTLTRPK